jgi:hypothetical protein
MSEHTSHLFKPKEYEVLHHIHQILEIPHQCQELLSAEKTPTLALALPTYEALVQMWKELAKAIPELSHYINLGIAKIMEYVSKGRWSCIYALTMSESINYRYFSLLIVYRIVINPKMKFKWIEEHWSPSELANAEWWMEEAASPFIHLNSLIIISYLLQMLAHCRARRLAPLPSAQTKNSAAVAQTKGFTKFVNLSTVRRTVSLPSTSRSSSTTPTPSIPTTPSSGSAILTPILSDLISLPPSTTVPSATAQPPTTEAEKAAQEAEDEARDLRTVRNELHCYKEEPPPPDNVPFDLVRYWNVCFLVIALDLVLIRKWQDSETIHPLIFKVALDILPVQASAVPCERVFSSSKETCILRRCLLSAPMLEVLQVLKHLYKGDQLDFASHWIANEDDYSIEKATEAAINELVSSAKCEELLDLLRSMDEARQQ